LLLLLWLQLLNVHFPAVINHRRTVAARRCGDDFNGWISGSFVTAVLSTAGMKN